MPGLTRTAPTLTAPDVCRFWDKVSRAGAADCWVWCGGSRKDGYGRFKAQGEVWGAHVIALYLKTGTWPLGFYTCHHCDNPPCCNPAHLFVGTGRDNVADSLAKGRFAKSPCLRGEQNGKAKLTHAAVTSIRAMLAEGRLTHAEIGARFGVSEACVSDVRRGRCWAD